MKRWNKQPPPYRGTKKIMMENIARKEQGHLRNQLARQNTHTTRVYFQKNYCEYQKTKSKKRLERTAAHLLCSQVLIHTSQLLASYINHRSTMEALC